jgi:hypothetical protein
MAYDPNLPANHSPIVSAELRSQFAGLKALIDAQQTQITALQSQNAGLQAQMDRKASMDDVNLAIAAGSARNVGGFDFSGEDISDPPQKVEVEDIQSGLSGLVQALKQPVADLSPVLTANNATMSLDWDYSGPVCDGFHIYVHQPNEAPGVFNDRVQVAGGLGTWATGFDSPADAAGYKYYIVPMDGDGNPLTARSNMAGFV